MKLDLRVRLKDREAEKSSPQNGHVLLVTSALSNLVPLLDLNANPVDSVRDMLRASYGSKVAESTPREKGYEWYWDEKLKRWIRICTESGRFEVDFGEDVVVVTVFEGAEYKVS